MVLDTAGSRGGWCCCVLGISNEADDLAGTEGNGVPESRSLYVEVGSYVARQRGTPLVPALFSASCESRQVEEVKITKESVQD